jgi:hypothetical protein
VIVAGDEETRPSLGSSTRARQSSLCSAAQASEVGRSKRHHGWANSGRLERNQHWGRGGRTERGSPPVTVLFIRSKRGRSEKEGDHGPRPCEERESRFGCPHVEVQLQKSIGDVWPRISSANALQKERQGRVNGGLALRSIRRVKPSVRASSETKSRGSASPVKTGEDRHETQGVERSASSGRHIAKSGGAVVGPGL